MDGETVVIYADEYVFINFCLDFACLYVSSRLTHHFTGVIRLSVAALVGALYALVSVYIIYTWLCFLSALICAAVICLIAFGYKSKKQLASDCFAYGATTAASGGLVSAIYSLSGVQYGSISPFLLITTALLLMPPALIYLLICKRRHDTKTIRAVIIKDKAKVDACLLVDSGNIATEPKSGLPLILICRSCLPPQLTAVRDEVYITSAIGSGSLAFFIPDRITVYDGSRKRTVKAAIAISDAESYGGANGLLPQSIL